MDPIERRHRASGEAADWWVRLQGDDMTRAEREAFIDWLRDSQTNIAEMLRLAQVHGALEQFKEWADISTVGPGNEAEVIPLSTRAHSSPSSGQGAGRGARRRTMRLVALAATVAAIGVVAVFLLPQWRGQVIATERGERREVVLDDGSVLQVDPQTRLNVHFSKDARRVRLTQGRALFRVAKNPNRPFLVQAEDTIVRAVGTAFGVERRHGDVVVTVSEGKVAVSAPSIQLDSAASKKVFLSANEQITVAMAGTRQPVRSVDSTRELAWAAGRLIFKNDQVAKVVAEFNRYNRVQLKVTDPALAARPVSGVFDAANPEAFIAFLQSAAPVRIERDEGRTIVISPSESR